MAILSAIVIRASRLKNILRTMDTINAHYARLVVKQDGIYIDFNIKGNLKTDPILVQLGLNQFWFHAFKYVDHFSSSYPLIFDFRHFCHHVRGVSDTQLIELLVNTKQEQVMFQLRIFENLLNHLLGTVSKSIQILCVPTLNSEDVATRTSEFIRRKCAARATMNTYPPIHNHEIVNSPELDINLDPQTVARISNPAVDVLQSSCTNNAPVDIYLSHESITLKSKTASHVFRFLGQDCDIGNFNKPDETFYLRLYLNRAPYLHQALTGAFVTRIEVLYPLWIPLLKMSIVLRLWFGSSAFLDLELPKKCVVHPELNMLYD